MCKMTLVPLRISVPDGGCQSALKRKILRLQNVFVVRGVTKVCKYAQVIGKTVSLPRSKLL